MTTVKTFSYSLKLATNDTNIRRVYWTTHRQMFIVFNNGRRYVYEKVSLLDYLDFIAKGEQSKSWRKALDFYLKWKKPEFREMSLEEHKEII